MKWITLISLGFVLALPQVAAAGIPNDVETTTDKPCSNYSINDLTTPDCDYHFFKDWTGETWGKFGLVLILVASVCFSLALLSPMGIVYSIATITRGLSKSSIWRVIMHIVQWLDTILMIVLLSLMWLVIWDESIADLPKQLMSVHQAEDAGASLGLIITTLLVLNTMVFTNIIQTIVLYYRNKRS